MTDPVVLRCPHPHSRCTEEFTADDVEAARELVYGHLRDQHWWGHGVARRLADGAEPVVVPPCRPVLDGPQPDPERGPTRQRAGWRGDQ